MHLDSLHLAEPVASVLAEFPSIDLPLTKRDLRAHPQLAWFTEQQPAALFPGSRQPECAQSGLLLLLGGWDNCHLAAQEIDSPEGSYWHAIAHRMEPDFWNSGYWFRRVGRHPIFSELRGGAADLAANTPGAHWKPGATWDPAAFLELCERSVEKKTSSDYALAAAIQSLECELLFAWCAAPLQS